MTPSTLHLTATKVSEHFLQSLPQDDLVMELHPGLGGAWTQIRCNREVIVFGYPKGSDNPWFQPCHLPAKGHNVLTQALERMVFARGIKHLSTDDNRLFPIISMIAAHHPDAVSIVNTGNT